MTNKLTAFRTDSALYIPLLRAIHEAMIGDFIEFKHCNRVIRDKLVESGGAPENRPAAISRALCQGGLLERAQRNGDFGFRLALRAGRELGLPELTPCEPPSSLAEAAPIHVPAEPAPISFAEVLALLTGEESAWLYSGAGLAYVQAELYGRKPPPGGMSQEVRDWRDRKLTAILDRLSPEWRKEIISHRFFNFLLHLKRNARDTDEDKEIWWTPL